MHPLAKRITLIVSLFSLVIGLFLLGSNLQIISGAVVSAVLNLWPILLILVGFLLVVDSTKKRVFANTSSVTTAQYPLPMDSGSTELAIRVQFSYGRLMAARTDGTPRLVTETSGSGAPPVIKQEMMGGCSEISIASNQPLFPALYSLQNTWRLELPAGLPLRLSLQLHEADLRMDLRRLDVESIDLRTESGKQEVVLGQPHRKLSGLIYASGSSLSVILPAHVFSWVRLLNPFCRVDYPQGDLEKRQDGSLITPSAPDNRGSVELDVDGPIRNLVLDIADVAE
ncbi:MAG: hypothetical protein ABSF77_20620 [Spirochaetia bacterium]|jgi:hypothetical protein